MIQAYNQALQQIAQKTEAEAAQKALEEAIKQDLNTKAADGADGEEGADGAGDANGAGTSTHTIVSGDTLSSIAKKEKVDIKRLYDDNKDSDAFGKAKNGGEVLGIKFKKGEANPNKIKAGKTLKINK